MKSENFQFSFVQVAGLWYLVSGSHTTFKYKAGRKTWMSTPCTNSVALGQWCLINGIDSSGLVSHSDCLYSWNITGLLGSSVNVLAIDMRGLSIILIIALRSVKVKGWGSRCAQDPLQKGKHLPYNCLLGSLLSPSSPWLLWTEKISELYCALLRAILLCFSSITFYVMIHYSHSRSSSPGLHNPSCVCLSLCNWGL